MLLDLLDKAGNLFDLPGSMVRDALTLNNPLDQLLSPLSSDNRMDGRDVLEKWGMLGPNTEGLDVGDVAGTAAGIALDPLTWVSGAGVMRLLGRGSKSAKAGTGTKAAQALLEAPTQSRALVPYRSPLQSVLQGPTSPLTPIDSDPFAIMREAMGQPKPAALPAPAPVFYSRLRRAIEQLPDNPKGFKSQSVLNMLKKAPEGISMEEFKWSGLPQQLEHTPIVSKAILMDAFDNMPVGINPIVQQPPQLRYEGPTYTADQLREAMKKAANHRAYRTFNSDGSPAFNPADRFVSPLTGQQMRTAFNDAGNTTALSAMVKMLRDGGSFEDAMKMYGSENIQEIVGGKVFNDSKLPWSQWDEYKLPNGRDYRETLLQEQHTPLSPMDEDTYTGRHWNQPNIGAHLRTTTRDLKGAGPTHFIDELQSDWHQEGRKFDEIRKADDEWTAVNKQRYKLMDEVQARQLREWGYTDDDLLADEWKLRSLWNKTTEYRGRSQDIYEYMTDAERAAIQKIDGRLEQLHRIIAPWERGDLDIEEVPLSPFRNAWQDLGLKRALYDAAAQGSDGIGWSIGEDIQKIVGGKSGGQEHFYDTEIGNRLRKLLAGKGQKNAKAEVRGLPDVIGGGDNIDYTGMANYMAIDPKTRARILAEGFPLLSLPFLAAFGLTGGEQRGVQ